jgi:hypothetical protein
MIREIAATYFFVNEYFSCIRKILRPLLDVDRSGAAMTEGPDFSHGAAFCDGRFVPIAEAKISVLDWGSPDRMLLMTSSM